MKIKTCINSEIGTLEGVIIHEPGPEVENMTPENAERALYSDILNLGVAKQEYKQLKGVLNKVSKTFEVKKLLKDILENDAVKNDVLTEIFKNEQLGSELHKYISENPESLANQLIEGIPLERNNLTRYLSQLRYLLPPLHNLFFTRDASMGMNDKILIGRMANLVRERESIIMEAIFNHHSMFETSTTNPLKPEYGIPLEKRATIEGGDFLVAREDVFIIGTGVRTSTQGIDFIIENLKLSQIKAHHIIVQELPAKPESFIHLDMVFTLLNTDACMIYEPVIFKMNKYRTIHILINGGKVQISEEKDIPTALQKTGIHVKPIICGGQADTWNQEREQWHSGANFFAFAPGKLIGYERNIHTIEELNKNGYDILKAMDVMEGKVNINDSKKCVVTIEGAELARGGGGARCMTMPFRRAEVNW